jgi:hypothetical protein
MFARIVIALLTAGGLVLLNAPSARAEDKKDDVFLDEGTTDDFAEPTPMAEPTLKSAKGSADDVAAKAGATAASAQKDADKRAADAEAAAKATAQTAAQKAEDAAKPAEEAAQAAEDAADKHEERQKAVKAPKHPAKTKTKPVAKTSARGHAKATASSGQFKTTSSECAMHEEASDESQTLITVASGKKVWVEPAAEGWFKAYRKQGAGFLSGTCFK